MFGGADKTTDALHEGFFPHDNSELPGGSVYWGENIPGDHSASPSNWHKIEYYVYVDATKGVGRIWHDGWMVKEWVGVDTHGEWTPFYTASNWSGGSESGSDRFHDAVNNAYLDDFEIYSDSPTGTPATGKLSDASIAP